MRRVLIALIVTCSSSLSFAQVPPAPPDVAAAPADAEKQPSGLASKVLTPGTASEKPAPTDVVTVHYTGWTADGRMFDSSLTRGTPSMFPLNRSLLGWRECVQLMTVGETRRCWLPQNLAYNGQAGRPAGSVVFDILQELPTSSALTDSNSRATFSSVQATRDQSELDEPTYLHGV